MKETLIGIVVLIAIAVAYLNMPLQWRRYKDIQHGNQLIENVQTYQRNHNRLPETQDTETLKQLGFVQNQQGWQPGYRKTGPQQFQIQYADGYAAPYLTWRSDQPQWQLAPAQP